MEHKFPSFPTELSEDERAKLTPLKRQAAIYGCPEKYFYLTEDTYREQTAFKIHNFKDIQVKEFDILSDSLTAKKQFTQVQAFLDKTFNSKGMLTIINGYPHMEEAAALLWHFVCCFSHLRIASTKIQLEFAFNFVGLMYPEAVHYQAKPRHTLAYGICSEYFTDHEFNKLVNFNMRFHHYNRIILISALDVNDFLLKSRILSTKVDFIFNVGSIEPPAKKKGRTKKKDEEISLPPGVLEL